MLTSSTSTTFAPAHVGDSLIDPGVRVALLELGSVLVIICTVGFLLNWSLVVTTPVGTSSHRLGAATASSTTTTLTVALVVLVLLLLVEALVLSTIGLLFGSSPVVLVGVATLALTTATTTLEAAVMTLVRIVDLTMATVRLLLLGHLT